jgi:neutral ceramidase
MENATLCRVCLLLLVVFVSTYRIGVGIHDITPSCSGSGMNGYGLIYQRSTGIHLRLRSRAFIIEENGNYLVYVSVELTMSSMILKREILHELQKRYGNIFHDENVIIAPTHTHSAPGGYTGYLIFDVTTPGFDRNAFQIM